MTVVERKEHEDISPGLALRPVATHLSLVYSSANGDDNMFPPKGLVRGLMRTCKAPGTEVLTK